MAGVRWAEARRRRTGQLQSQNALTGPLPDATPPPALNTAPLSPLPTITPDAPTTLPTLLEPTTTPVAPTTMPTLPPTSSPSSPNAPSGLHVTEPDDFFAPLQASSTASPHVIEPNAFFTSPAGVTPSIAPSNGQDVDVAAFQRVSDDRPALAEQPPSARQGYFDSGAERENSGVASSTLIADSTALPTPAPVAAPEGYDYKAEDATSIEATDVNAAAGSTIKTTVRPASPGLFSTPLLVGAALLIALVAIGIIAFTMAGSAGSHPEDTITSFMNAYSKGDTATYNKLLTPALQQQMTSDTSIQSYFAAYQKDIPQGFRTTPQKIANPDDPTSGKPRVEYYLYGKSARPILDFGLEKNGSDWLIYYIGCVGCKLASGFVKADKRTRRGTLFRASCLCLGNYCLRSATAQGQG
ncbi:MAG: hypothetical protein DLM69_08340 [Candidatus Chloroheliales bacterium]|nr:MAG: hypothetical protein DLM69_08340 [Chloroflexota bacterium]